MELSEDNIKNALEEVEIKVEAENNKIEKELNANEIQNMENSKYNSITIKTMENIPKADEYYSKIEKNDKGIISPRITGIFILFDNIYFYFNNFQKYQFFKDYKTFIPYVAGLDEDEQIENYIKENTTFQSILQSKNISFDDIISDYILYIISKSEKLQKDSCDIKYIFKILLNIITIGKKNMNLDGYKCFINIIQLFNIAANCFIYPLSAIKYLNDEKIIEDAYNKILKEISQFEKETNIVFIIIESFFNLLINEIMLNKEIIPKLNYIHLFLMNIINTMNLETKSFYTYMQFKSLYKLIKKENNKSLNDVYKEIYDLKNIFDDIKREETLKAYKEFYEKLRSDYNIYYYSTF